MKMRDRFGEREAEACALVRTAGVEPTEAPPRFVAPLRRDPAAAIGNLDPDVALTWLDPDPDFPARGTIADRILNEVAHCLGEKLAMAEQRHRPGGPVVDQRRAALIGERVVHFDELGRERTDVEPGELFAAGQR